MTYYKTGNLASINDGYGHSTDITSSQSANFARPAAVTANGNNDFAENYTWNTSFLGLTQETGPNQRQSRHLLRPPDHFADGAVITYAYTNLQLRFERSTRSTIPNSSRPLIQQRASMPRTARSTPASAIFTAARLPRQMQFALRFFF